MAQDIRKFVKGVGITPSTTSPINEKGELRVNDSDGKLHYHNGTSESPIVTESHTATLTNKTIDGDDNTLQDIALTSLKADPSNQNRVLKRQDTTGIVISGNPIPNSSHEVVTTEDTQTLKNKTIDTDDNPNVSVALNKLKNGANNVVLRRNGSGVAIDGNDLPNSSEIVTVDANQTLTLKKYEDAQLTKLQYNEVEINSTLTGSNAVLNPSASIVVLTNSSLVSIEGIHEKSLSSPNSAGKLILINRTGQVIQLLNNTGTTLTRRIITGTDDAVDVENEGVIHLLYDIDAQRWKIVGGVGGSVATIKVVAGENLNIREPVYLSIGSADGGRTVNRAYKLDATNDNRIEFVGFTKSAATAGNDVTIIISGVVKGFSGLTPGLPVYLSPTVVGGITQLEPENSAYDDRWVVKLGSAISSTSIVVNPDLAASAYYKLPETTSFTIANNQTTAANISGLVFPVTEYRGFVIEYYIYRETTTTGLAQIGQLRGVYNAFTGNWMLSENFGGDDAGVDFSITVGGQLRYTSTNLTGSGYSGILRYKIVETFGV